MIEITPEQRERIMLDVLQEIPAEETENVLREYFRREYMARVSDVYEKHSDSIDKMAGILADMRTEDFMSALPAVFSLFDVQQNGMPDYA